jgi:hypothetical protein
MNRIDFQNFGIVTHTYTDKELYPLRQYISKIENNFNEYNPKLMGDNLVGQINREYELDEIENYMFNLVAPVAVEYERQFSYFDNIDHVTNPTELCIQRSWVNFQTKNEYNPVHDHRGVLSFVLYLQIPYNKQEEGMLSPKENIAGDITFTYPTTIGRMFNHRLTIDQSAVNSIVMFPSWFCHSVAPFRTTEGYRISVAGNLEQKVVDK